MTLPKMAAEDRRPWYMGPLSVRTYVTRTEGCGYKALVTDLVGLGIPFRIDCAKFLFSTRGLGTPTVSQVTCR